MMITALWTGIGEEFDISKARYHKVVIMTDADVDGAHIRTLLLTFFYRYMKPLLEHGYVYIAQPPLFKIQQGRAAHYDYTDSGLEEFLEKLQASPKPGLQRNKGFGTMYADNLYVKTILPAYHI